MYNRVEFSPGGAPGRVRGARSRGARRGRPAGAAPAPCGAPAAAAWAARSAPPASAPPPACTTYITLYAAHSRVQSWQTTYVA